MENEKITLKNTKTEILDALNAALEREKNMSKIKSNPVAEEKKKKVEEAIETSKKNVDENVFSEELNNKFKSLETAILAEEEKLKELYGIEKEVSNLTLVVNAGKDCLLEIENKKKIQTEELSTKIKSLEDEYKQKEDTLQKEYEQKAKVLKLERDREVEEYNYKLKREREISNNKWEDEKKEREAKLKAIEDETIKLFDEAKEKAEYIEDLEKKVSDIPALLEKEYQRGKKETTTDLEKEHKYSVELLSKDYKNTIDRQEDKIESLKEEVEKLTSLNAALQEKMYEAYAQIKELATKTVEANGGVKILGNNSTENK